MTWYKLTNCIQRKAKQEANSPITSDALWFNDTIELKQHAVTHRNQLSQYKRFKLQRLDTKKLYFIFQEILLGSEQGLSVTETLESLKIKNTKRPYTSSLDVLVQTLKTGSSLKDAFQTVCNRALTPYTIYLLEGTTNDATLISIRAASDELSQLIDQSKLLLKSLLYPFLVIQISFCVSLLNSLTNGDKMSLSSLENTWLWVLVSCIQIFVMIKTNDGTLLRLLSRHSKSLQLKGMLGLAACLIKCGIPTHLALKKGKQNLRSPELRRQACTFELRVRQGIEVQRALPEAWFNASGYSMITSAKTGIKLEKALTHCYELQKSRCKSYISYATKAIPALCLLLAGSLVGSTILDIYRPLLEANTLGH